MALTPGTSFGPYEIQAPLGAGGMGEVYRATDPKLGRDVAIKVLPEEVAADPERLARFEREARVLASLSHANIGAIYGLEESGGVRGLVLELIEGKTLQEILDGGPLPAERAIGFARQIAEALEAAHEKGIVHRDLKPANVKVTPEGVVKVLDFGLAKAYAGDESQPDSSMSPTLTVAATRAGIILGTAAYMSPEQAAGQGADRRSDVWSFGVVLLEMLTGRRPFTGETVSHTLASILKEEPDLDHLPADVPPRLIDLLRSCLQKKPRQRLQAIGDARVLLEEYLADPVSFARGSADDVAAPEASGGRRALPWALAGMLAVALVVTLGILWPETVPRPAPSRVNMEVPENETLFRGYGSSIAISPDGSRLAWVGEDTTSVRNLYLRFLDRWDWTLLVAGDPGEGPYHPFFSPDGQWIGFVTRSELKKVPVRGGSPITLCRVSLSRGATWSPDGTIIFAPEPGSGLFRVPAAGGEPEPLTELDASKRETTHRWPQVLPGGRAVLFTALADAPGRFDLASVDLVLLDTGERRRIQQGGSYGRYLPSGQIVYLNRGTLFAMPFDLKTLEVTGSAAPVLEHLASNSGQGGAQFAVSDDGTLVYESGGLSTEGSSLVWVDSDGNVTPLSEAVQNYGQPVFSPDGTRLAFDVATEGDQDVWVYDLDRDVPTRLTFTEGDDQSPVWSPDGRQIYFASSREGNTKLYRIPSDGSGEAERILDSEDADLPTSVSPDGKRLAFNRMHQGGPDIWILSLDGGEAQPFLATTGVDYGAQFSPDGRWIAYGSNESGTFQVYVRPADGGGGKWQISTEAGTYPVWSRDGRTLYYRDLQNGVVAVAVDATGGTFRAGRPRKLFRGNFELTGDGVNRYTVAPDEGRFLMLRIPEKTADEHESLRIVFHWFDDLAATLSSTLAR